ncbi:sugar transferase [Alphaproteobacteria bacterium]|nr:sugar transferase [Alphaproteobacteria bacterium]
MSITSEINYIKNIGNELESLPLVEIDRRIQSIGAELTLRPVNHNPGIALILLGKLFGLTLFLFTLPIILVCCLIVFLEDLSNPIFVQKRYGLNSKIINIFKIRTLYKSQSDKSGKIQVNANDKRITKSGWILRGLYFDELPQFVNLIIGNLSIVGPRVQVPGQVAGNTAYENYSNYYLLRHLVTPGLTGLAQCLGYSGPTNVKRDASARLYLDLTYVSKKSKSMDIAIIILTVVHLFSKFNVILFRKDE